jgi:hypothetical protein
MPRDRDRVRLIARAQFRQPLGGRLLVGVGVRPTALEAPAKLGKVRRGQALARPGLGVALEPAGADRVGEVLQRVPPDPEGQLGSSRREKAWYSAGS